MKPRIVAVLVDSLRSDVRVGLLTDKWHRLRGAQQSWIDIVTTGSYLASHMKAVGVKQLKARLSEYVRLVKGGETILVTDRDEVVAELRPARRQRRMGDDLEDILQSLADAGEVTRASMPKLDWTWRVKGLGLPAGTAQRALDEVRADRRPSNA